MNETFVKSGSSRLSVMRNGGAVVRAWKIPKPVVLMDTREQMPLPLVDNHHNWISGEKRVKLKQGITPSRVCRFLSLERKSLADAIGSTMAGRARFVRSFERLAAFRLKAIIVEATYEDMKTAYALNDDLVIEAHPNAVCGTLDAIEAKFGIPILYTSQHRALTTEKTASWLSKHFTYWWLEQNNHERALIDTDGL